MGWTYQDLMTLPQHVYDVLIEDLNTAHADDPDSD
jgi:hypothetical protein